MFYVPAASLLYKGIDLFKHSHTLTYEQSLYLADYLLTFPVHRQE